MKAETQCSKSKLGWVASIAVPICIAPIWATVTPESLGILGSVMGFQLLLLLIVATFTDLAKRKIYNFSTFTAFFFVLVVNGMACFADPAVDWWGAVGLISSMSGALACFFVVFLAYQCTGCGAGDVKMATAIGAAIGLQMGLSAIVYSYVAAAVIGGFAIAITHGLIPVTRTFAIAGASLLVPGANRNIATADRKLLTSTIPMAPFFSIGTLVAVLEGMS